MTMPKNDVMFRIAQRVEIFSRSLLGRKASFDLNCVSGLCGWSSTTQSQHSFRWTRMRSSAGKVGRSWCRGLPSKLRHEDFRNWEVVASEGGGAGSDLRGWQLPKALRQADRVDGIPRDGVKFYFWLEINHFGPHEADQDDYFWQRRTFSASGVAIAFVA